MSDELCCPHCGETVFVSEDGTFQEDDEKPCPECGMRCIVGSDDGEAYVQYTEEFPNGEQR